MIRETFALIFVFSTFSCRPAHAAGFPKSVCEAILELSPTEREAENFQYLLKRIGEGQRIDLNKSYLLHSTKQRVVLARALLSRSCHQVTEYAPSLTPLPAEVRIEIAETCAGKDRLFYQLLKYFEIEKIATKEKIFEWALKQAARGDIEFAEDFVNVFGNFSQAQRVQIAELHIESIDWSGNPKLLEGPGLKFSKFDIKNETERARLLMLYWLRVRDLNPKVILKDFAEFAITSQHTAFELAVSAAQYVTPVEMFRWIPVFRITNMDQLKAIALTAVNRGLMNQDWHGNPPPQLISSFDDIFRYKLYEICLRRMGDLGVGELMLFGQDSCSRLFTIHGFDGDSPIIAALRLRWTPMRALRHGPIVRGKYLVTTNPLTVIDHEDQPANLPKILAAAKGTWEISFPKFDLSDRVKRPQVAVGLLAMWQDIVSGPRFKQFRHSTDSLAVLLDWLGLEQGLQLELHSRLDRATSDSLAGFYEAALAMGLQVKGPVFANLKATAPVNKKTIATLVDFLNASSNLMRFTEVPHRDRLWRLISEQIRTLDDLLPVTTKIRTRVTKKLQRLLNSKHEFSYEQFALLEKNWKSLEPVFTLVSRFEGNPEWRNEIPMLTKVFHEILQGTFKDFKFGAGDQTPKVWRERHLQVDLHTAKSTEDTAAPTDAQKLTRAIEEVQTGLLRHFSFARTLSNVDPQIILGLLDHQPEVVFDLMTKTYRLDRKSVAYQIAFTMAKATNLSQFSKLLDTFEYCLRQSLGIFAEAHAQLEMDVASLRRVLSSAPQESNKPSILITTSTHDPKLLLTIGDLVPTGSCQNYQYGCHIETLLGYVVDPNIQALLGFVLQAKHFKSNKEFEEVFAALIANSAQTSFMDPDLAFEFKLSSGKIIRSLDLSHSYRRHILRLGKTPANGRALMIEKAYQQTSKHQSTLEDQAANIFTNWAREMGAATSGEMEFEASKNPGGVYTDSGGGVKTGPYRILVR